MTNQDTLQFLTEPLINQSVLDRNEPDSIVEEDINVRITSESVKVSDHQTKSKNIRFILTYTFLIFAGRSIWNQSVLSAFVFLLKNNNPEYVGYLTGIMGVFQLLISFPSGVLADKYRRDSVVRIASVVGMIASMSTIIASIKLSFTGLEISLALWGIFLGISKPAVSALFADSISDGERSYYFTQRTVAQFSGSTAGPVVSLIMFSLLGDEWKLRECAIVMCAGNCVCIPAALALCFLNDDYCISQSSHEEDEYAQESLVPLVRRGSNTVEGMVDCLELNTSSSHSQDAFSTELGEVGSENLDEVGNEDFDRQRTINNFLCIPETKVVPTLVVIADFMGALASGMSTRYFPIFLLHNLNLKPNQVQIIYIVSTVSAALVSKLAHYGGKKIGRLIFTALSKWIGVIMMIGMILSYQNNTSPLVVCLFLVLRMAITNSSSALTKSVLMDAVPKNERGRWSSLEAVNTFNWSGSAALGGILVNLEGIVFNFVATATFQLVATVPLVILIWKERCRSREM